MIIELKRIAFAFFTASIALVNADLSLFALFAKSKPKRPAPQSEVNSKLFFTLKMDSACVVLSAVCFVSYSSGHPAEQCAQVDGTRESSQAFAEYLKSELTNAPTGQTAIHSPQKVHSKVSAFLGMIVEL